MKLSMIIKRYCHYLSTFTFYILHIKKFIFLHPILSNIFSWEVRHQQCDKTITSSGISRTIFTTNGLTLQFCNWHTCILHFKKMWVFCCILGGQIICKFQRSQPLLPGQTEALHIKWNFVLLFSFKFTILFSLSILLSLSIYI